jgi:hypothetical protein
MSETRYCSNCRAELPPRATECPACGVFAGDVFDGRKPRPPRRPSGLLFFLLVVVILGGAAWWFVQERQKQEAARLDTPPPPLPSVRVVGDRPGGARRATGAAISEAEAIRVLRRHLVATLKISNDCLGVLSALPRDGAYILTAINGCDHTRLGRWRVDGRTSAVTRAK